MSAEAERLRMRLANIPDQSMYEGWASSAHPVRMTWNEAVALLKKLDEVEEALSATL